MTAVDTRARANSSDVTTWRTGELERYIGGLSRPSKMPGWSYSIPASVCAVGSRLRGIEGSACSYCYALKGRYVFPNVQRALQRRLESLQRPQWVAVMAELLSRRYPGGGHFRWHDSGDLQSLEHLRAICAVAERTPDIAHWLPTRETRLVLEYLRSYGRAAIPENLTVRISAPMIGGKVPTFPALQGSATVSVISRTDTDYPDAHDCPSRFQNGRCGDCRACWSRTIPVVSYRLH